MRKALTAQCAPRTTTHATTSSRPLHVPIGDRIPSIRSLTSHELQPIPPDLHDSMIPAAPAAANREPGNPPEFGEATSVIARRVVPARSHVCARDASGHGAERQLLGTPGTPVDRWWPPLRSISQITGSVVRPG
jgi:hypothetical protein